MSVTDKLVANNTEFARNFKFARLSPEPVRRLAVVACMDTRIVVEAVLGLKPGEAHIVRNAGGIVTEDVLRSLIISSQLLGTREIVIINHTDCGMTKFSDEEIRSRLQQKTGAFPTTPAAFHTFHDVEENVRAQVKEVRDHAWMPRDISIRGFVYDVGSGVLREVPGELITAA